MQPARPGFGFDYIRRPSSPGPAESGPYAGQGAWNREERSMSRHGPVYEPERGDYYQQRQPPYEPIRERRRYSGDERSPIGGRSGPITAPPSYDESRRPYYDYDRRYPYSRGPMVVDGHQVPFDEAGYRFERERDMAFDVPQREEFDKRGSRGEVGDRQKQTNVDRGREDARTAGRDGGGPSSYFTYDEERAAQFDKERRALYESLNRYSPPPNQQVPHPGDYHPYERDARFGHPQSRLPWITSGGPDINTHPSAVCLSSISDPSQRQSHRDNRSNPSGGGMSISELINAPGSPPPPRIKEEPSEVPHSRPPDVEDASTDVESPTRLSYADHEERTQNIDTGHSGVRGSSRKHRKSKGGRSKKLRRVENPSVDSVVAIPNHASVAQLNGNGSIWNRAEEDEEADDDVLSSDPDDLDGFTGPTSVDPKYQIDLLKFMVYLHQRRKQIAKDEDTRRKKRVSKYYRRFVEQHGGRFAKTMEMDEGGGKDEDGDLELAPDVSSSALQRVRDEQTRLDQQKAAVRLMQQSTMIRNANVRKVVLLTQKEAKRVAKENIKAAKEIPLRAKRVAKEMLAFWRRNEREERELRKKAEKEAQERRKVEEELREAKRQARKLNFLITQTELYSHFIGKKMEKAGVEVEIPKVNGSGGDLGGNGSGDDATASEAGRQAGSQETSLDPGGPADDLDSLDDQDLEVKARQGAQAALEKQLQATRKFDEGARKRRMEAEAEAAQAGGGVGGEVPISETVDRMDFMHPSSMREDSEILQPKMLTTQLKPYQLKGLNWLVNLYEQGINGILADEMVINRVIKGLGKTIQSISLMAHLAEAHNIWGPFLVITPVSTLHNWQQEIARFAPQLKTLPYWGNQKDRAVLRKFWTKKTLYTKDAPFHVLITSYQLVVTDEIHFTRIKWQYMILDEAQAIKSSTSDRWRILLGFNCRNRLLLTGTPIQNTMQELWALLHFIMPTLFDSHQEFSEWFSRDIESHAENKGTLNEHQLRRLHMILKPFMLRRVKKDVELELSDKVEREISCSLTGRQKKLYAGLKQKLSLKDLMENVRGLSDDDRVDSLMNIVMQFRKVCSHPELFERADVTSPVLLVGAERWSGIGGEAGGAAARRDQVNGIGYVGVGAVNYAVPKTLYREASEIRGGTVGIVRRLFNIFHPQNVVEELADDSKGQKSFSFLRFVDTSPSDLQKYLAGGLLVRWVVHLLRDRRRRRRDAYLRRNEYGVPVRSMLNIVDDTQWAGAPELASVVEDLVATTILLRLAPAFVPSVLSPPIEFYCRDRSAVNAQREYLRDCFTRGLLFGSRVHLSRAWSGADAEARELMDARDWVGLMPPPDTKRGSTYIGIPSPDKLITDSGKMLVLDELLPRLKAEGHRVLIYFQMTKMIDLMEEYLTYRQHSYVRLDGGNTISERRDVVMDWQTRPEIFIFLLSTRAGGLGINLTAADTVIFYDSDWNPTVDQQAMDRAHRLGQTKQVTVYRLITAGTIEERILVRAKQKDEIHKVVISGGEFKQQVDMKPKEVLSLLLDNDELEEKMREDAARRKIQEEEKEKQQKGKKSAAQAKRKREKEKERKDTPNGGLDGSPATPKPEESPTPVSKAKRPRKQAGTGAGGSKGKGKGSGTASPRTKRGKDGVALSSAGLEVTEPPAVAESGHGTPAGAGDEDDVDGMEIDVVGKAL
ncbi:putative DNA helicase ino80 [Borealophlyctis nickersoniae]|nr:putative DNA helicase ino80 [Borealophlyctis nickersoniae]